MLFERTGPRVFRVTGANHFAGFPFYRRTIEGVESVQLASAARNDRRDSVEERLRQSSRMRLDAIGVDGARLSWGREQDSRMIDDFMRGTEARLVLADPPPWWRVVLTWFSFALGLLIFFRAVQCILPKKAPR